MKKRREDYLIVSNRVSCYFLICRFFFFRNDITLDRPSEKQIKGGRGGMYISFSFVFAPSLLEWFFPYLVY